MKKELTREELDILWEANDSTRGTKEYMKYWMPGEMKHKKNGTWTGWKWVGWGIACGNETKVKKFKEKVFIMSEEPDEFGCVMRYEVTPEVNELLKIF